MGVNGARTITLIAGIAFAHEMRCIRHRKPEELITRVIYRWRRKHPLIVSSLTLYLAGHLLEVWARDPLSEEAFAAIRETMVSVLARWDCAMLKTWE